MKKNTPTPSGADALIEAHPLMIKAKKWAKKLKKEISSHASAPALNLMRAQEIVCRQLGFENLHALRSRCLSELFPSSSGASRALWLWPETRSPSEGAWRFGRSISGLQAGAKPSAISGHILIERSLGSACAIPLCVSMEALSHGLGLTWIGKDEQEAEALHQKAIDLGRASDVRRVSAYPARAGQIAQRHSFSGALRGPSGGITQMMAGLLESSETNTSQMWRGRAISLLSAVSMALCYLRDAEASDLTFDTLRSHLSLDRVVELSKRPGLPRHIKAALRAYLKSLPGYAIDAQTQIDIPLEQHGYLQMQFQSKLNAVCEPSSFFSDDPQAIDLYELTPDSSLIYIIELPAARSYYGEWSETLYSLLIGGLLNSAASRMGQAPDPATLAPPALARVLALNQAPFSKFLSRNLALYRSLGVALCVDLILEAQGERDSDLETLRAQIALRAVDPIALARLYREPTPPSAQLAPNELAFSVFYGSERLDIVGKALA